MKPLKVINKLNKITGALPKQHRISLKVIGWLPGISEKPYKLKLQERHQNIIRRLSQVIKRYSVVTINALDYELETCPGS